MIKTYEHASELDADKWNGIMPVLPDIALGTVGLALQERNAATDMRYLVDVDESGTWIAGLPCALATDRSVWVLGRPDRMVVRAANEMGDTKAATVIAMHDDLAADLLPSLVLGGRHMGNSAVLLSDKVADKPAMLNRLLDAAQDQARAMGAKSMAFPFLPDTSEPLIRLLKERGWRVFGESRYSKLDIPAGGFDEYLSSFGRKWRWKIRNEREQVVQAGFTADVVSLGSVDLDRLGELEYQLLTKYGLNDWDRADSVRNFQGMVDVFGPDAQVGVIGRDGWRERNNLIAGFVILLRGGGVWSARQIGFDYTMQGTMPLYFEVLFYKPIELAAVNHISRIDYGTGSEHTKALRGCYAESQRLWLKEL